MSPIAQRFTSPAMRVFLMTSVGIVLGCVPPAPPLSERVVVTVGGVEREAFVLYPRDFDDDKPTPLLFSYHGYTSSAGEQDLYSGIGRRGTERGYVVIMPQGLPGADGVRGFSAGVCCTDYHLRRVDDLSAFDSFLEAMRARMQVDDIFSMGLSNGGFMSHHIACQRPTVLSAFVSVAGLRDAECPTGVGPPGIQIHGTDDDTVPYTGENEEGWAWLSARDTAEAIRSHAGCREEFTIDLDKGEVRCMVARGCARAPGEAGFCTVVGGGHTWPGALPLPGFGHTTADLDATGLALDYFDRARR